MLPPVVPPFSVPPGLIDAPGHTTVREELARNLIVVISRAVAIGRLAGDADDTIRSVLRFSLARAIDSQGPILIRSG